MTISTIRFGSATAGIDTATGAVRSIRHRDREFVRPDDAGGLVQLAVPLADFPGHTARVDHHGSPEISTDGDLLIIDYPALHTDHLDLAVQVTITVGSTESGLVLRAGIENRSDHTLRQVAFPQLLGLSGLDDPEQTRVQLARNRVRPFVELAMSSAAASRACPAMSSATPKPVAILTPIPCAAQSRASIRRSSGVRPRSPVT